MTAEQAEQVMVISSIISILFSSCLLISFGVFPELFKKNYHRVVFYMASCDFMASIGGALGTQTVDEVGAKCWIQYILTNYFMVASILWCTSITVNLYFLVVQGTPIEKKQISRIHLICWGIPFICTFFPFITEDAGVEDDYGSWCYLVNRSYSTYWIRFFWIIFSIYFWVWISFIIMIVCLSAIYFKIRSNPSILSGKIEIALNKLKLYPVATFLSWFLATVHNMMSFSGNGDVSPALFFIYRCLQFSSGVFTTIIFFHVNKECRVAWHQFFEYRLRYITGLRESVDDRVSTGNILDQKVNMFENKSPVEDAMTLSALHGNDLVK